MTSYNGQAINYDTIGNPLTYKGSTLTWTGGRELKSLKNANNSISYTYDANGIRATKTVNGVKSTYEYAGSQLVYEKRGNMDIYYFYDSYGNLSAIRYANGSVDNIYYAVCNSRGDVEAFYNGSGTLKSRYVYDTWGNVIKIVDANGKEITDQNNVAFINPIRYRGYYYDTETGFYYLKSRYYDPEVGRFINADGYVSTGQGILGNNMFAYCGNNPVIRSDSSGEFWLLAAVAAAAAAAILSGCSSKTEQKPEPYKSADDAAMAFANSTYSSSRYIRHEYGTAIYSRIINRTTTYNYAKPVSGSPHSVGYSGVEVPSGTTIVATAHTHPNSNSFSGLAPGATSGDIPNAMNRRMDSYVIGPNLNLQKFSISSQSVSIVGIASPVELTSQQQSELISQFQISWDNHLGTCNFGCENMSWPTP